MCKAVTRQKEPTRPWPHLNDPGQQEDLLGPTRNLERPSLGPAYPCKAPRRAGGTGPSCLTRFTSGAWTTPDAHVQQKRKLHALCAQNQTVSRPVVGTSRFPKAAMTGLASPALGGRAFLAGPGLRSQRLQGQLWWLPVGVPGGGLSVYHIPVPDPSNPNYRPKPQNCLPVRGLLPIAPADSDSPIRVRRWPTPPAKGNTLVARVQQSPRRSPLSPVHVFLRGFVHRKSGSRGQRGTGSG